MTKNKLIDILVILTLILSYYIFLIIYPPQGVDWPAYSTIRINFLKFYFFREPVGWLLPMITRNYIYGAEVTALIIQSLLLSGTSKLMSALQTDRIIKYFILLILCYSNFYLLSSVNGIRQGLALAFVLLAFSHFLRSNYRWSVIYFVLSISSHNSALLLLIIPLLMNVSKHSLFLIYTTLYFLSNTIIAISSKNKLDSFSNNTAIYLFVSGVIFISGLYFKRSHFKGDKKLRLALFILPTLFVFNNGAYERLVYYFIPLQLIFYSKNLTSIKPKLKVYAILLLITFISLTYTLNHPSVKNNFLHS